jgi:hypothetical protein
VADEARDQMPKPLEEHSGPPALEAPKWIKDATAFVALLGTLVGICLSIWGLARKSRDDSEAAKANLDIARLKADSDLRIASVKSATDQEIAQKQLEIAQKQLDAHKDEYLFQDRVRQEQRVSEVVTDLFKGGQSAEGQIAVLSSYITADHKYDDLIGNSIAVKLESCQSTSEVELAFNIVGTLRDDVRLQSIIQINESARDRYDAALMQQFWQELAGAVSQVPPTRFDAKSRDQLEMSPGHQLFSLVSSTESSLIDEVIGENRFFIDDHYLAATINQNLLLSLFREYDPEYEKVRRKEDDGIWWADIRRRLIPHIAETSNLQKQRALADEIMARTSQLLPSAILSSAKVSAKNTVHLNRFYFFGMSWPPGNYPTIDFGYSVNIPSQKFGEAVFNEATFRNLMNQQWMPTRRNFYEPWEQGLNANKFNPVDWEFLMAGDGYEELRKAGALPKNIDALLATGRD